MTKNQAIKRTLDDLGFCPEFERYVRGVFARKLPDTDIVDLESLREIELFIEDDL